MPNPPPKAKATPTSEKDKSWLRHLQSDLQKEPERLEEAAKFLVGIISICLTIFLSNRPDGLAPWTTPVLMAATILWVFSAVVSFWVLFPLRYEFPEDSPEQIRQTYRKVSRNKRQMLIFSFAFFLIALMMGAYAFLA